MNPRLQGHSAGRGLDQLSIPLSIVMGGTSSCSIAPVQGGLCVPRGKLRDASVGRLLYGDTSRPVQLDVVNRWSDESVRWMTASFTLPGEGTTGRGDVAATLSVDEPSRDEHCGLTRIRTLSQAILITQQHIDRDHPVETRIRVEPVVRDSDGQHLEVTFESVREEISGPLRHVSVISGRLTTARFVTLQFRVTVWPGTGLLLCETRIRNSRRARHRGGLWDLGDTGSFLLQSLKLRITNTSLGAAASKRWKVKCGTPFHSSLVHHPTSIVQFGSGGEAWNSTNHMGADGTVSVKKRGYEVTASAQTLCGDRADPVVGLQSKEGDLFVAVPEFWQQFPGSLSVDNNVVTCGLFPATHRVHELQGGEQKTRTVWVHGEAGSIADQPMDWVFDPPRVTQPADWMQAANVFPWFPGERPSISQDHAVPVAQPDPLQRLSCYLNEATTANCSVAARREVIDEYGWRNYGDMHADHEQTHFSGSSTVVSHYNNQFDAILGGILNFASSGDTRWFDLFAPMARHVMDIDIYHTAQDRAVWNGGLFWHTDHYVDARLATHRTYSRHNQCDGQPYGGGPCNEHNYTTGLMYYFFLTGHPEAREAVLSLAEWVIQMDDGRQTVFGLLDDGPTGYASHTVFADFHGPGRGAGNSVNALVDAWTLTEADRYLHKAEELIRRCVHPRQDIEALDLLDAEGHWSYTVFLTALGRYLLAKDEAGQRDEMYSYARNTMSHFGRWMVERERPSLSQPEELKYPTEAWAAQDFRKANVLRIAASCEDDACRVDAMRNAADRLNDAAWRDLYTFGKQHLTARCLSIVMTEGQRDVFHRSESGFRIPAGTLPPPPDVWAPFVPQRMRVKQLLKSPRMAVGALCRAVNPLRCWKALQSYRRYR
jgi:hypothetical protein